MRNVTQQKVIVEFNETKKGACDLHLSNLVRIKENFCHDAKSNDSTSQTFFVAFQSRQRHPSLRMQKLRDVSLKK